MHADSALWRLQLSASLDPHRHPLLLLCCAAFKSSDAGWAARGKGEASGDGKFSAFLGDYVAVPIQAEEAAAPTGRCAAGVCLAVGGCHVGASGGRGRGMPAGDTGHQAACGLAV